MTDYDDLCNGAGEWKNIYPVVRSALFGQAYDMIALKSHLVDFNKKLVYYEAVQKELLARQSKPDEKVYALLTYLNDRFVYFQRQAEKRLEDLEEKYLESEHIAKYKYERFAARVYQVEEGLGKELQGFEKRDVEHTQAIAYARSELKYLRQEVKAAATYSAPLREVEDLRKVCATQEQMRDGLAQLSSASNDAIARLYAQSKQNFEQFKQQIQNGYQTLAYQVEQAVEEHSERIPSVEHIYELARAAVAEQLQTFATKTAVYQIAYKLQEKTQVAQTSALEAVRYVAEEAYYRSAEHGYTLHTILQKQAEYASSVQSKLLELAQIPQMDKKLARLELEVAYKMDSGSLAGRSFVTAQQLEEEITNALRSCYKQIKSEVEGFIDNQLYRTVKSIIKAELDIYATHSRTLLEEQMQHAYERMLKKISKEISPEDQLNRINYQCDDVRALLDMLSNDVDFKLTKTAELQEQKLNAEISSVRHAIDSLNNVVYSQNDLVACKIKEFDMYVGCTYGTTYPTAKWLWKSKKLTYQNAVIWSSEEVNTLQSNFIWERSKSQILIVAAGCYYFKFAVFTRKRPTVQILINGEPIISAMSGGVYPALYSVPKLYASQCYFSQGLQDWLYLAANSVVQLVIGSEFSSCLSGFLEVAKMW